ncbi:hypothetical protein HNV27_13495, partial [Myxococcus xanthus]|nr:hypothetical protein [Myxococcus xanthus]
MDQSGRAVLGRGAPEWRTPSGQPLDFPATASLAGRLHGWGPPQGGTYMSAKQTARTKEAQETG